ncbi:MAG: TetR/AcrR family transcriptional regulator [Mycobacteriaceae bacterium]
MRSPLPTPETPALPQPADAEKRDPRLARSRARLVRAATQLLSEGGVEAVTIDAVTRAAGVARATLYRHFSTGAELLATAFEQLLPPVAATQAEGSLRDRLLALLDEQGEHLDNAPLQVTTLSWLAMGTATNDDQGDTTQRPQLRQLRERLIELYRQPFDAILASPQTQADLGPDFDLTTALAQLGGPLIFNRLVTHQPNDHEFCTRIVDDFLAARHAHHS